MILNNKRYIKVTEAAKVLGVHPDTLRRWDRLGLYKPYRTPNGTRLYLVSEIRRFKK